MLKPPSTVVILFRSFWRVRELYSSKMPNWIRLSGWVRESYVRITRLSYRQVGFYVSGMSAKARGVTDADVAGKPAEFAMPAVLVKLATDSDRIFTY